VRSWPLVAATLLAVLTGCGYVDDNPRAVRIVAQDYLDSLRRHDAGAVCTVLAPEVQAAIAAGATCEEKLPSHWRQTYPKLDVGGVHEVSGPAGNPRFNAAILEEPRVEITLGRYGSIWRVVGTGSFIR
jgi:hypothetical protein